MKKKIVIISSLVVLGAAVLVAYTNATVVTQGIRCDEFIHTFYSNCEVVTLPQSAPTLQYYLATTRTGQYSGSKTASIVRPLQACPYSFSEPGVEKSAGVGWDESNNDISYRWMMYGRIVPGYRSDYSLYGSAIGVVLKKGGVSCMNLSAQEIDEESIPVRDLSDPEKINIQKAVRSLAGTDNGNYTTSASEISGLGGCYYQQGWRCQGISKYLYDYYRYVTITNPQQFCEKTYNCLLGRAPDTRGLNSCIHQVSHGDGNLHAANMVYSDEFIQANRYRRWMAGDYAGCVASAPQPPNPPPVPPPGGSCSNGYWKYSTCNNNCSEPCAKKAGCGNKWYCH